MAADTNLPRRITQYGTHDRCRVVLEKLRWPSRPRFPRCGSARVVSISTRALHRCIECKQRGIGSSNCRDYKTTVIGAVKRGGPVRLEVIEKTNKKTFDGVIKSFTKPNTKAIYTDEHADYVGIADHDTRHATVNHSEGEYVRADVHTNTVRSLFRRSVAGGYHQISVKHMDRYLDEQAFRFDNRKNPYLFRDTLLKLIEAKAMPSQGLVQAQ